jgi:hypothetical protein
MNKFILFTLLFVVGCSFEVKTESSPTYTATNCSVGVEVLHYSGATNKVTVITEISADKCNIAEITKRIKLWNRDGDSWLRLGDTNFASNVASFNVVSVEVVY